MFLDFGEVVRNNHNASPDVFHMASMSDTDRAVTFTLSGEIAPFISEVRFDDSAPTVLEAFTTERVRIEIWIPQGSESRDSAGKLTVHVEGWADDLELAMVITVRAKKQRPPDAPSPAAGGPVATPMATVSPAVTPATTPTASTSPVATPLATPMVTPTPSASASSLSDPPPP